MTPARCAAWRPEVEAKLAEFLTLEPRWNSYAAAPISPEATRRALALLDATMRPGTPAPSIVPFSDGGVQLEWHCRGLDIEIGVHPLGQSIELWCDDAKGRWPHEYEVDDQQTVGWLRDLLAELTGRAS